MTGISLELPWTQSKIEDIQLASIAGTRNNRNGNRRKNKRKRNKIWPARGKKVVTSSDESAGEPYTYII